MFEREFLHNDRNRPVWLYGALHQRDSGKDKRPGAAFYSAAPGLFVHSPRSAGEFKRAFAL